MGQRVPLFCGGWGETTQGADDFLPGAFGGVNRLDQEVIGVGFVLVGLGGFANVDRTLYK